jgi:hypothetical protein
MSCRIRGMSSAAPARGHGRPTRPVVLRRPGGARGALVTLELVTGVTGLAGLASAGAAAVMRPSGDWRPAALALPGTGRPGAVGSADAGGRRWAWGAGLGAAVALGVHLRWIRPQIFSWGASGGEVSRPMPGDDLCRRPQLNATRAVTIAAPPEDIWPWLAQWGWNRAGFYSYDLLDNLGRPSARQVLPQFQDLAVGDWVPMGGKPTPATVYRVTRLEPAR